MPPLPDKYRRLDRELRIPPLIIRCGTELGSGLGDQYWVVDLRPAARLSPPAHPRTGPRRHPRSFLKRACALICWRRLTSLREQL
jgi:hypothetical protein